MTFGQAIAVLKAGARVSRAVWNSKSIWLELQVPDANSKMTQPYIFMRTAPAGQVLVPWAAGHGDLLADDWVVVEP